MRTAVLIPALNEGDVIKEVIEQSTRACPGARVFVVDGGSVDGTPALARAAGATVVVQRGTGYAAGLASGYEALLQTGFDRLVQLDADGQHPPDMAGVLLDALGPANWVIGSRAGTRSPGPLSRRVGSLLLGAVTQVAARQRFGDVTSGFWALDPVAVRCLLPELQSGLADANLRVHGARQGLVISEHAVTMRARLCMRPVT